jgi:hypothetical protein
MRVVGQVDVPEVALWAEYRVGGAQRSRYYLTPKSWAGLGASNKLNGWLARGELEREACGRL